MKNLYICMTYHHVLTSIAKSFNDNVKPDIILCNTIPDFENLLKKKQFTSIFDEVIIYDEINSRNRFHRVNNPINIKNAFKDFKIKIKNTLDFPNIDYSKYNDIILYHDNHMISFVLRYLKIFYTLAEDGIDHFKKVNHYFFNNLGLISTLKKIKQIIFYNSFYNLFSSDGTSKYVKKVEMNSSMKMIFRKKTTLQYKKSLFLDLNVIQKTLILSIFLDDKEIIEITNIKNLLLTEPLYGDKRVNSIENQISVYKDILNEENGFKYAIKPHPRDNLNYKDIFPDLYIVRKSLPIEIINFFPKIFERSITINSSSIDLLYNFKVKLILYKKYRI
jgi:hypothetical protein